MLVGGQQDVGQIVVATGRGELRLSSFKRAASAFKNIQLHTPATWVTSVSRHKTKSVLCSSPPVPVVAKRACSAFIINQ
ncbi:hypothetical protein AMD00_19835 [Viridibacillus arvi]|uniref:Uncharacterized protein n=1 Tax=Viridibacillus arvi TaxID=263475 RepID=A0A0M0L9W4_9BACL|nr:hypothetical protein AMD00_19835 [Viridibacillus arvi]